MAEYSKNEFKFREIFLNSDGKTSGSGFIGVIGAIISLITLLLCSIGISINIFIHQVDPILSSNILSFSVVMAGVFTSCVALLGYRKKKESENA